MSAFAYTDERGVRHEVLVCQSAGGDWQVLDVWPDGTRLVDSLDPSVDERRQAEAVARDYVETGRFLAWTGRDPGEEIPEQGGADADSDPSPRPQARRPGTRRAALPHPAG